MRTRNRRSRATWGHPSVPQIMNQMLVRHTPSQGGTPWMLDWGGTARLSLEITHPHTSFGANHRVRKAYTGLTWSIRIGAIGGVYPYLYELENAPSGMTINASTGVVTWTNPQSTATDVVARVTDTKGTETTRTWTITVGTSSFVFLDAVDGNDSTGDGTISAPWKTLNKLHTSADNSKIAYFRDGTYTLAGITTAGAGADLRVYWGSNKCAQWVAYPGDAQPVIDEEYTGSGPPYDTDPKPGIRLEDSLLMYFDGLKFYRGMAKFFWVFCDTLNPGMTWRNCLFEDTGPGMDTANCACLMFAAAAGNEAPYAYFDRCEFTDVQSGTANSAIKVYTLRKLLVEGCYFHDSELATEQLALKAAAVDCTIRGNHFKNVGQGVAGNMAEYFGTLTSGEVCFNLIEMQDMTSTQEAIRTNHHGENSPMNHYRNTCLGRVTIVNASTGQGPFKYDRNVIVNADSGTPAGSHITYETVTDASTIEQTNTECHGYPADGIVDVNGLLQGSFRTTYLGLRGHEVPS